MDSTITESKLMRARWGSVVRLARALGVQVARGHGWRRRYVTVRRIVEALDRPAG